MRYKVGDKVVIRDDLVVGLQYAMDYGFCMFFTKENLRYKGKVLMVDGDWLVYSSENFGFTDEMIDHALTEKLNEPNPIDLLETGMIVELRNSNRYLVLKGDFEVGGYGKQNIAFVSPSGFINITHYDEYLKYKGEYSREYDVFKVYKSNIFGLSAMLELRQDCELIWERNQEPKQPKVITYTTQELMDKLGLDGDTEIKIVDKK